MFARIERWLAPRLLVVTALLALLVVTLLVPQVANVLLQLPGWASFAEANSAGWSAGFYLCVVLGAAFSVAGGLLVAPLPALDEEGLAALPRVVRITCRVAHWPLRQLDKAVSLPLALAARPGRRGLLATLALAAVAALGPVVVALAIDDWSLHDPGRRFFTLLSVGWCVALAIRHRTDALLATLAARFATMSVGSYAVGEAIWLIVPRVNAFSYRLYTIWGIFHLYFVVIALARALDLPKRASVRVALSAATAMAAVIAWSVFDRDDRIATTELSRPTLSQPARTTGDDDLDRWLEHFERRLAAMPSGPVLVVANAGGGSRAAIFATLVLESLQRTDLSGVPASPSSLDPRLVDRVLLLSGVSGGSLASAYYVHRRYLAGRSDENAPDLKNAPLADLERALGRHGWRDDGQGPPWPLTSRDVDAMFTDFTAPVLRGIVLAGLGRGQALAHFWNARFGWQRPTPDVAGRQAPPLLLLNTARVESGERVIVGEPALPAQLAGSERDVDGATTLSLCSLCGSMRGVALADAVRMSANFPWVVDLPYLAPASGVDRHSMIDGGAFDNTGLDALSAVFARLRELADQHTAVPTLATAWVRDLLRQLADRGVVVIEVDSGAKPTPPGAIAEVLSPLLSPLSAVGFAAHAFARQTSVLQIERLGDALRGIGDVPGQRVRVVRYVYATDADTVGGDLDRRCTTNDNRQLVDHASIMTAWSLGPADKADLLHIFLCQEQGRRRQLNEVVADLASRSELRDVGDERGRQLAAALLAADAEVERTPGLHPFEQRPQQPLVIDDVGARAQRGWIFLGQRRGNTWQARATIESGAALPSNPDELLGHAVTPTSWSYAWGAAPDADAKLGAPLLALPPGTVVTVDAVEDWEGTGLVFAHVRAATPAPAPHEPADAASDDPPPLHRAVQQQQQRPRRLHLAPR